MNHLVIFGGHGLETSNVGQPITIDGASLACGLVPATAHRIDHDRPELARTVAVRVAALSCNYRDRSFIQRMRAVPSSRCSPIGSEFVGEVIDVGAEVTALRPGDRVIPNHHYVGGQTNAGVREGIATNQASRRFQLLHEQKLMRVPSSMPDDVAAGFSLGAQTAYSMVRRLDLAPGSNALVMGGSSNTGLFLIAALRKAGAVVYATTSAPSRASQLRAAGADAVIVRPRGARSAAAADPADPLREVAQTVGGFAGIADPFFDVHLADAVDALAPYGRYITCGLASQNDHLLHASAPPRIPAVRILITAIQKNLTIMGNCIGFTEDLASALADYETGTLAPVIDSVFEGDQVAAFFDRTYNDADRFGKVVFRYDD